MKKKLFITSLTVVFFLLFSLNGFANKTSVKITAPEKAEKGTEVCVKIEVNHIGNSKAHYTEWVKVKINGEEYKTWEYKQDNLPENQNFEIEFKITIEETTEIVVEGNCNKHGSKGEEKVTIQVK